MLDFLTGLFTGRFPPKQMLVFFAFYFIFVQIETGYVSVVPPFLYLPVNFAFGFGFWESFNQFPNDKFRWIGLLAGFSMIGMLMFVRF